MKGGVTPKVFKYKNTFISIVLQEKSSGRNAHYKLTSTAMLWLQTSKSGSGTMNLGGSLTRQVCIKTFQNGNLGWNLGLVLSGRPIF